MLSCILTDTVLEEYMCNTGSIGQEGHIHCDAYTGPEFRTGVIQISAAHNMEYISLFFFLTQNISYIAWLTQGAYNPGLDSSHVTQPGNFYRVPWRKIFLAKHRSNNSGGINWRSKAH